MQEISVYDLDSDDIGRVNFSCRLISNRQERSSYIYNGKRYIEPYGHNYRTDMYWIECRLDGVNLGSLCIDPCFTNPKDFSITRNHNKVREGYNHLVTKAREWFKHQSEYQKQVEWTIQLREKIEKDCKEGFTEPKLA